MSAFWGTAGEAGVKLQTEHLGVDLRLLYPIGCCLVVGLRLDYR
jgi:hypothetical protein